MIVVLILIIINGLLAMSEIAVVSARKVRLRQQAEAGNRGAAVALELANEPSRFLSTVQIGITLVAILSGVFGEALAARQLEPLLEQVPLLAPQSRAISVAIVVVLTTYLSLVIGELVPKRVALTQTERVAALVGRPMRFLATITAPLVSILSFSTDLVVRLMGIKKDTSPQVTDEEVKVMLEQGAEAGIFEPIEGEIVEQLFRLSDRNVKALITPRPDIVWLDLNSSPEEIQGQITNSGHTRFPVAQGELDNVVGVVLAKDLLAQSLAGEELNLRAVMQSPLFVPEAMPALELLEKLREARSQIALVIDEYGGLEGLVTLYNIMEEMIGDIPETEGAFEPEVIEREDGSWLLDGRLPIDEFQEMFDLDELPDGTNRYFQTLGGFVMSALERIPVSGDHFEWGAWRFEVVDMDGRRVDKVLLSPWADQGNADGETAVPPTAEDGMQVNDE